MQRSRDREKLINAIIYFASNTRDCGKIKLIKLLYLLDFEHFRQTGRPVTGQDYFAWELGPVPQDFYVEFDEPKEDLAEAIEIVPTKVYDFTRLEVRPRREFDPASFTRRELSIMQMLAERFKDDQSKPMVNVTHDERGPWATIWEEGNGKNSRIPYRLAITATGPEREELLSAATDFEAIAAGSRKNR